MVDLLVYLSKLVVMCCSHVIDVLPIWIADSIYEGMLNQACFSVLLSKLLIVSVISSHIC
jgi:hypothetical protein